MTRAILYNKVDGKADEVIGVIHGTKNTVKYSSDMPEEIIEYFNQGIPAAGGPVFPKDGISFIEALPEFFRGKNLYVILKD